MTSNRGKSREHTAEEIDNFMRYGWCWICREPRQPELTTRIEGGRAIYESRLVCPNGHPQ